MGAQLLDVADRGSRRNWRVHNAMLKAEQFRLRSVTKMRKAAKRRDIVKDAPPCCLIYAAGWLSGLGGFDGLEPFDGLRAALMAILRGFFSSGTTRSRSIWSRPFSSRAACTSTCSASWNWRSKARPAMP